MSATTEALTQKLSDLHEEVAGLKCQIVEAVRVFYGSSANVSSSMSIEEAMQFASKWSQRGDIESDLQIRMKQLESILDETVSQLQPESAAEDNQIQQSIATKTRLHTQIQQSQEMLKLLRVLSELDTLFQSFDIHMDQLQYEDAAAKLASMESLVAENKAFPIMQLMHVQTSMRKNQLYCALDEQMDAVCFIQPNKMELFPLQALGAALQAAKRLQYHIDSAAASMNKHIVQPLLADASLIPQVHANTLSLLSKPNATEDGSFAKVLEHLLVVFKFVHAQWQMPGLGSVLWKSHLAEPLENLFLKNLPSTLGELPRFREQILPLQMHGFDASMQTMEWAISASVFMESLERRYAQEKRQRVLVAVRTFMQKDYMDSVLVKVSTGGSSGGSSSGKKAKGKGISDDAETNELRVSLCTTKLLAQVESLLQEASTDSASPEVSALLFHTARDSLFLFRMGMPSMYKEALLQDPRVVMLLHNDCMYLTQNMLTCVYPLKAALPQGSSMIDMVPEMRELGEFSLMHFAKTHTEKMIQSLQTCPTWSQVHEDAAFNQVETCIKVILFQFQRMLQHWKDGGLAPSVYATLLSRMLQPLVVQMIESLLKLSSSPQPIKAIHSVHHLFALWLDINTTFYASQTLAEKHISNWKKFQLLTQLMEDSLAGLQDKWQAGALREFSKQEMASIIKCFFTDSTQRQQVLEIVRK
ncbi:unnamed protein product [Aphanomyces euteiches]